MPCETVTITVPTQEQPPSGGEQPPSGGGQAPTQPSQGNQIIQGIDNTTLLLGGGIGAVGLGLLFSRNSK